MSDVNAKEDLSRTPKGCLGPPREVPDDPKAQKCNKNQWFFNDFEMALNALGGPKRRQGVPLGPSVLPRDGLVPPRELHGPPNTNQRSPKALPKAPEESKNFQRGGVNGR